VEAGLLKNQAMRQFLRFIAGVLVMAFSLFISCNKELSCENCKSINQPPVAKAGRDTIISLPKDSLMLDGSASTDPDGTITSYKWVKIAGPVSSNITKPDSSKTLVKTLAAGVYQVELSVTDNGGLSAKDTVQILVDNPAVNQPPIACAGADQTITLPTNTVTLDGSCSADADNNTSTYIWTKIAGPAANIANANLATTQVAGLLQGIYQFELKVIDAGGLFSKDTIQVTVNAAVTYTCGDTNLPIINAQVIPVGTLSQVRGGIAVASAGNKILFAGGLTPSDIPSSRVDIYDLTTQAWSTAELSEARYDIAAIGAGNKIIFAGGEIGDGTCPTKTVDIYDVSTNQWSASSLSIAGYGMASAVVGNKVLFSGGNGLFCGSAERSSRVDIYNLTTNSWSTASLSNTRIGHAAVTVNNKVYFSGGFTPVNLSPGIYVSASNTIDIYDDVTNTWSNSLLTEGKGGHAGIAVNDKIFWAGGYSGFGPNMTRSCSVEIMNPNTGSTSIQQLFKPGWRTGVVKNNQIIFYTGDEKFDVYDAVTNKWSIGVLPFGLTGAAIAIISINNTIYLAGGLINGVVSDKVWKLAF
jgi:hypothetical protein